MPRHKLLLFDAGRPERGGFAYMSARDLVHAIEDAGSGQDAFVSRHPFQRVVSVGLFWIRDIQVDELGIGAT